MRIKNFRNLLLVSILTLVTLFQFSGTASAQTTAFNFQGRLNAGANPANGNFDFEFKLFDSVAGGSQIGGTVTRPSVAVINGIFSTQLDFGAAAFSGEARFVEIGVRPSATTDPLTILSPRQQVLSAPYAIQAKNAAQLGGIDASEYVTSSTVGNTFIKNGATLQTANLNISGNGFFGGNVGVGTAAPDTKFQVLASGFGITQTSGGVTVGTFISTAGGGSGWFGTRSNHPLNFFTNNASPAMTIIPAGNVGIGTTAPTARLEIQNVPAGTTGVYAESPSGRAIWGKSTGSRGVYGESSSLEGVYGVSVTGAGVSGNSGVGIGVYGESTGSSSIGVYARNVAGGRALYVEGNAAQTLAAGGLLKAAILVNADGTIARCYNSQTNASTGNCGFTTSIVSTGVLDVNFGFQVDNRYATIGVLNNLDQGGCNGGGATIDPPLGVAIRVRTFCTAFLHRPFMLLIF
jgi:hypothetical protein